MHIGKVALLLTVGIVSAPVAANANSVTYDFTGAVTAATGIYSSVALGTAITGTYTFDYANATETTGTAGISSTWNVRADGGAQFGLPSIMGPVFSSTVNIGSLSYSSAMPTTESSDTSSVANGGRKFELSAQEGQFSPTGGFATASYLTLVNLHASPFDSEGLPIFVAGMTVAGNESGSLARGARM
jgi:hypothetical protein